MSWHLLAALVILGGLAIATGATERSSRSRLGPRARTMDSRRPGAATRPGGGPGAARRGGEAHEPEQFSGLGSMSPFPGAWLGAWPASAFRLAWTRPRQAQGARWAARRDIRALSVNGAVRGRVVIGRCGRNLVAAEAGHSLLVVGPTQSGKTTGLAAPIIREWEGPVVAASVKGDLARLTLEARSEVGEVLVYDPLATTGLRRAAWSPLDSCRTWARARRLSADLAAVARDGSSAMTDGDFWYSMAAKLLAPLLLAAACNGLAMSDIVAWVDHQDLTYPEQLLTQAGERQALQALCATLGREDRQRSGIFTTAETVIEAFADPDVAECEQGSYCVDVGAATAASGTTTSGTVDVAGLLDATNTLYLCAPAQDQRRLRPLFATLVAQVVSEAYGRAMRTGRALDPPLLVVLDEAANVAPLAELDVLASTAAGHGVQLVTVWQDLAQLNARYGSKGSSVVNNHRAKLFLSGIADPGTLEHASQLAGEEDRPMRSTTIDRFGSSSTTDAPAPRRLVSPDAIRRLEPGSGLLLYAHLPPAKVTLRRPPQQGRKKRTQQPLRTQHPHNGPR